MGMFVLLVSVLSCGVLVESRAVRIPKLAELRDKSDVIIVVSLNSIKATPERRGNAVETIADVDVHLSLKGKCKDKIELSHLLNASEIPGVDSVPYANGLLCVDWDTQFVPSKGSLIPKESKLYLVFASKSENGDLEVFRTASRDSFGVFVLSGGDAKTTLLRLSVEKKYSVEKK